MSKRVIAIKGVPPELYHKVKEKAIEMGIPIGKAVTEALELWLNTIANKKVESYRQQVLEHIDKVIRVKWYEARNRIFLKIYRRIVNEGRKCLIDTDVLNNFLYNNDYACSIIIRDLLLGKVDFILSILSLIKILENSRRRELAEKLAFSLPPHKIALIDWKVLVKAIELIDEVSHEMDIEHAIIVAQMMIYDVKTIISSDDYYDKLNLIRIDPLS